MQQLTCPPGPPRGLQARYSTLRSAALEKIDVTAIGSVGEIACIDFATKYNVRCTCYESQLSNKLPCAHIGPRVVGEIDLLTRGRKVVVNNCHEKLDERP